MSVWDERPPMGRRGPGTRDQEAGGDERFTREGLERLGRPGSSRQHDKGSTRVGAAEPTVQPERQTAACTALCAGGAGAPARA